MAPIAMTMSGAVTESPTTTVVMMMMMMMKVVDGRAVGDFIGVDGQLDFVFVPPDDVVAVFFDAEGVDGVVGIVDRWGSDGSVRPFVRSSVRPFVGSSVRQFVGSSVRQFGRSVDWSI